jgi:hypothetical protein
MGKMSEELALATIKQIDEKNSEKLIETINDQIGMDVQKLAQINSMIREIKRKIYKNPTIRDIEQEISEVNNHQGRWKQGGQRGPRFCPNRKQNRSRILLSRKRHQKVMPISEFTPDYVNLLRKVQERISNPRKDDNLEGIVKLVQKTKRYDIRNDSVKFDLCLLDKRTVGKITKELGISVKKKLHSYLCN